MEKQIIKIHLVEMFSNVCGQNIGGIDMCPQNFLSDGESHFTDEVS